MGVEQASESLVERIGFWNCVTGLVLLGNIGQRTCGENIDYMRDNVFLGGALGVAVCGVAAPCPARRVPALRRRRRVARFWAQPLCVRNALARWPGARRGALHIGAAHRRAATRQGLARPGPVRLRLDARLQERTGCGILPGAAGTCARRRRFFAEACAELVSIARAEGMPELPTGTSVVAMLKTDAAGDAAADVPRFENYAPLGSNGKVAAWLIGEECKLTDAAKQLFGPDLAAQFEIAQCRILARMVRTSCSLHQFEAIEPGDEPSSARPASLQP